MKKKGFTLIELLAVIIILAVIALIATPVVLNIIEQVKIKGAEASAKGYAKAVEYEILNDTMFAGINLDGEYDVEENTLEVVYQGNGPSEGYFILENNTVKYGEFCINGYGIKYENSIGKYSPNEVTCSGSVPKHEFIEPEGEKCTDIENYDEETNFKIKTVEDLVCISNLSKNGKTFSGKTVSLLSDIDIKDSNSYNDINDTTYGDINGNGTVEGIQTELTTGQGFLPIGTSSSKPFSGTFEGYGFTLSNLYINRSSDNVGLFGYVTNGLIKGINIEGISVKGNNYVGGVVGYSIDGIIKEISISGNIIASGKYAGGITGSANTATQFISVLLNTNVTAYTYVGGVFGQGGSSKTSIVLETGTITETGTGQGYRGKISYYSYDGKAYVSNQVKILPSANGYSGTSYTLNENMLNGYDGALDTWIGGDNDSSGYYFDYDENNKIVVKSVERDPITFTLKGEGTKENPYLINSYQQWKEATTKVKQDTYFKLNKDIDFIDKPYYAFGSAGNYLVATLDGGYHNLSNIIINGTDYSGLVGYNNGGTIKGLNIKKITVNTSNNNIGGLIGYNASGNIIGINIEEINIKGNESIGGIIGHSSSGVIKEVSASGNITASGKYAGGIAGKIDTTTQLTSILLNTNVTAYTRIGGVFGQGRPSNVSIVLETGTIHEVGTSQGYRGKVSYDSYSGKIYVSNQVKILPSANGYSGTSYTLNENMLNGYDEVLDTWIGGDNDSSGYYFDYDSNNKIIVKSVEINPITFTLAGSGTSEDPYIINNYKQWKEATTKVQQDVYFKLNKDIDFIDKPYYAFGSAGNYLVATLDGGYHNLSNIIINGTDYSGLVGYNNGGTIKGLNIKKITVNTSNNNIGGLIGYNASGNIIGINIEEINIKGNESIGGIVGHSSSGVIKEVSASGNITASGKYAGGIAGKIDTTTQLTSILLNTNVTAYTRIGGVFGQGSPSNASVVLETGTIHEIGTGQGYKGKVSYDSYLKNIYVSNNVVLTGSQKSTGNGTAYVLELPTTVTYTQNNNRVEVDSLSYYDSKGVLDTRIGGDNDSSGYYLDYNSSGNKIIVVPVGGTSANPGGGNVGSTGSVEIDSNYTMTQINGTTDTTAPTCELYYVRAVSNGIQASFSCTDDSGVPTLRSLFDSTTSKSAATFDNIGTLKNGSVSGNTKTVVSTWNIYNTVSQPTPGTCYYFRYGAQDAEGNFSTYVTNMCYNGFSE